MMENLKDYITLGLIVIVAVLGLTIALAIVGWEVLKVVAVFAFVKWLLFG
jgi:hypothetical protein